MRKNQMTFEQAIEKFNAYKNSKAPHLEGVHFRSRGKYYPLQFDLELIQGSVAIVAKQVKETEETEPAKLAKRR